MISGILFSTKWQNRAAIRCCQIYIFFFLFVKRVGWTRLSGLLNWRTGFTTTTRSRILRYEINLQYIQYTYCSPYLNKLSSVCSLSAHISCYFLPDRQVLRKSLHQRSQVQVSLTLFTINRQEDQQERENIREGIGTRRDEYKIFKSITKMITTGVIWCEDFL